MMNQTATLKPKTAAEMNRLVEQRIADKKLAVPSRIRVPASVREFVTKYPPVTFHRIYS